MSPPDRAAEYVRWALFLLVVVFLAWRFTALHIHRSERIDERALPWLLVQGTAWRPFQYRALIPWIVRVLCPGGGDAMETCQDHAFFRLEVLSVVLLILSFRQLLAQLLGSTTGTRILALTLFWPLASTYVLTDRMRFWYPADLPATLFFCLGMLWLQQRRWLAYYLLFVIATFNRETTALLTCLHMLVYVGHDDWRTLARHAAAQGALWIAVKSILFAIYANNPGAGLFESQVAWNLRLLAMPGMPAHVCSAVGYLWVPALVLAPFSACAFVRRSVLLVPVTVLAMMIAGALPEIRIFSELIPLCAAATIVGLRDAGARSLSWPDRGQSGCRARGWPGGG